MPLTRISKHLSAALAISILLVGAGPGERRFDLFALALGVPIEAATSGMAFSSRGRQLVARNIEAIPRLFESQTVVLQADEDARLAAIHIQIAPGSGSTGSEVLRLADQVRSRLIDRFGVPSWERREGRAPADQILFALSSGEIVRMAQWQMEGRTVRAGIPRRIDGRVIVEIAITEEPLLRDDLFWSAE